MITSPGWYVDPSGRYEHRYHNGVTWTADVAVGGRRYVDPAGAAPVGVGPAPVARRGSAAPATPAGWTGHGAPRARNRLAVAALVVGIVAASLGWIPFVALLTLAAAVVAVALGIAGRGRARHTGTGRSFATWGIALGVVGLLTSVLGIVFTGAVLRAFDRYEDPPPNRVEITSCTLEGQVVQATGEIANTGDETSTYTIRVELRRRATRDGAVIDRVTIDDLGPGETVEWIARGRPDDSGDDARCTVDAVRGPLPLGVDPDY